jgi:hypothetical protein
MNKKKVCEGITMHRLWRLVVRVHVIVAKRAYSRSKVSLFGVSDLNRERNCFPERQYGMNSLEVSIKRDEVRDERIWLVA